MKADALRQHLMDEHPPMPARVLDAHTPEEWEGWHDAEHRTRKLPKKVDERHPVHLRHEHDPATGLVIQLGRV